MPSVLFQKTYSYKIKRRRFVSPKSRLFNYNVFLCKRKGVAHIEAARNFAGRHFFSGDSC